MRWRIEDYIFCERQQNLTSKEKIQQLEPMLVELLAYFCRHTDQIISRDQLIDQVWLGRVITDNAVSKAVTKLRKYFNDNPRKPQFIATFPKKGYKFIALVSPIAETKTDEETHTSVIGRTPQTPMSAETSSTENNNARVSRTNLLILSIVVLMVIAITNVVTWQLEKKPSPITQVRALTRDPGSESRPQISPDGQYLAYVEVRDKKMRQWIKALRDETSIEVSHGDASNIWVDSVSWNSDGSKIVYLVTTPDSCRYFIRTFNAMAIGEPELIHNCPAGSYGKIAFTLDDKRVIYTENKGRNTPFTLFEMSLTTGAKRKLNQPEVFLGGK